MQFISSLCSPEGPLRKSIPKGASTAKAFGVAIVRLARTGRRFETARASLGAP
jgi:hypothetical protein